MPISLDKQLLFVRIPNEMDAYITEALELDDNRPHGIAYYLDKYPGSFTGTKKFCAVRNPWDRLAYFFKIVQNTPEYHDHGKLKDMTFEDFVKDLKDHRNYYENPCWHPQTAWIWSQYGPIVNHIFVEDPEYLETPQITGLADQFQAVMKMDLGIGDIDRDAALALRKELYTPELVEIVTEIYKNDINAFNYVYDAGLEDSDLNILDSSEAEAELS